MVSFLYVKKNELKIFIVRIADYFDFTAFHFLDIIYLHLNKTKFEDRYVLEHIFISKVPY